MAVNDIFRVDHRMLSDDRIVSVSNYYNEIIISTGSQAEVTEAIATQAEIDFWTTFWKNEVSDDISYHDTICQQVYPSRQAPFVSDALAGDAGGIPSPPMNGTTAVLIAQYGIDWSRNFQGRMYLPGMVEASVTDGRLSAAAIAAMQTAANTFFDTDIIPGAPAGGGYTHVVASPSKMKLSQDPVFSLMGQTPVRPRIATQRRRRTNVLTPS
jgi:hypothetical protein